MMKGVISLNYERLKGKCYALFNFKCISSTRSFASDILLDGLEK